MNQQNSHPPIDPALQLQPGQQELTPAQEAEAQRFARAYIKAQLSTEPIDEQEAEGLLRHVYQVAKLPPPARIQWLDDPLQLVMAAPERAQVGLGASIKDHISSAYVPSGGVSSGSDVWNSLRDSIVGGLRASAQNRLMTSQAGSVRASG